MVVPMRTNCALLLMTYVPGRSISAQSDPNFNRNSVGSQGHNASSDGQQNI